MLSQTQKIKTIFFGTSDFAIPVLAALNRNPDVEIVAVVTTLNELSNRDKVLTSPPMKMAGEKLGLKVLQPKKLRDIELPEADIAIAAAYGKILPEEIINKPKYGMLVIHPSLLPKYRGPSPVQYALLNGETETGVTIIQMDSKIDHGPILSYVTSNIEDDEMYQELNTRLWNMGAKLLIDSLPDYIKRVTKPREQNHTKASYSKLLSKEDGKIDWNQSAQGIYNKFRAFHKWPGIWTRINNRRIKILDCYPSDDKKGLKTGEFFSFDNRLFAKCNSGSLEIISIQPEGKKQMKAKEFMNGYANDVVKL